MNNKHIKNYYIGDDTASGRAWQDQYGQIHCQVWLYITKEGPRNYTIWKGGCSVGHETSLAAAKNRCHKYAVLRLREMRYTAELQLRYCDEALNILNDTTIDGLETFEAPYEETDGRNRTSFRKGR
mgnify:CR=1 FL=1